MSKKTKFICISGPQGAGKTFLSHYVAKKLKEEHGKSVNVDAIAAPIYEIARALTKDDRFVSEHEPDQRAAKSSQYAMCDCMILTGREILQDIGRAFRKLYGRESFWVEQLIARNAGKYDVAIISDCRMPSEAEAGCFLIWIETENDVPQQRPTDETERHLTALKARASLRVVRSGDYYGIEGQQPPKFDRLEYMGSHLWGIEHIVAEIMKVIQDNPAQEVP